MANRKSRKIVQLANVKIGEVRQLANAAQRSSVGQPRITYERRLDGLRGVCTFEAILVDLQGPDL
jgi:hypothetical protein